jgi:plasmid stabilization system protein ParE
MRYTVEVSRAALADIEEAYQWLFERSPQGAARWFNRLMDATESLRQSPERCRVVPDVEGRGAEVRQLLVGSPPGVYRVFFSIHEELVRIHHVRHAARESSGIE